jgi:hypothetical protein
MTAWVPPLGTTSRIQFRPKRYLKSSNAIPLGLPPAEPSGCMASHSRKYPALCIKSTMIFQENLVLFLAVEYVRFFHVVFGANHAVIA